jgi:hypothetical protein
MGRHQLAGVDCCWTLYLTTGRFLEDATNWLRQAVFWDAGVQLRIESTFEMPRLSEAEINLKLLFREFSIGISRRNKIA